MSTLSKRLRMFADKLGPTEDRQVECNRVIAQIQRVVQELSHRGYPLDRFRPAGSYTKKTALDCKFDLDLVAYFNFPDNLDEAGFKQQRKKIASVIEDAITLGCRDCEVDSNDFGVQVKITDLNLEIDVVVAVNLVPKNPASRLGDVDDDQYDRAMELIQNSRNPKATAFMLSSSMTEKALKFVWTKSPFVHSVIRLAKFWNAICIPPELSFSGQSSTMEIMAVKAGMEEEANGSRDVVNAFNRFLSYWLNLGTLNITFDDFYTSDIIPAENRQAPVVLDPANPYNNRLFRMKPEQQNVVVRIAQETLLRLNDTQGFMRQMPKDKAIECSKWMISMLIFPPCCPRSMNLAMPSIDILSDLPIAAWCTDFEFNNKSLSSPRIERRRVTPLNRKAMEEAFKRMWAMLHTESEVSGVLDNDVEAPYHTADGMISFLEKKTNLPRGFCNDPRNYDIDYDATFKFPVGNGIVFIIHVKW